MTRTIVQPDDGLFEPITRAETTIEFTEAEEAELNRWLTGGNCPVCGGPIGNCGCNPPEAAPAEVAMTKLNPATREFFANYRNGRRQCWGVTSADGRWHYRRTEETGTPWVIEPLAGQPRPECWMVGALDKARRVTAEADARTSLPDGPTPLPATGGRTA